MEWIEVKKRKAHVLRSARGTVVARCCWFLFLSAVFVFPSCPWAKMKRFCFCGSVCLCMYLYEALIYSHTSCISVTILGDTLLASCVSVPSPMHTPIAPAATAAARFAMPPDPPLHLNCTRRPSQHKPKRSNSSGQTPPLAVPLKSPEPRQEDNDPATHAARPPAR